MRKIGHALPTAWKAKPAYLVQLTWTESTTLRPFLVRRFKYTEEDLLTTHLLIFRTVFAPLLPLHYLIALILLTNLYYM
jgi:hypothetical protein